MTVIDITTQLPGYVPGTWTIDPSTPRWRSASATSC